jgi:hypothetical protein
VNFELYPLRFRFAAQDSIYFPAGKPGNILRGAFGTIFKRIACVPQCREARDCDLRAQCAYARIFEPASLGDGPSGLADWPRPFVFRASHLDGCTVAPSKEFYFDLNVFELRDPALAYFVLAFSELAREGLGPRRGRAALISVWQLDRAGEPRLRIYDGSRFLLKDPVPPLSLPLDPPAEQIGAIRIEFATPTELKSGGDLSARPDFPVLFARVRDRVSTLRGLYGPGSLDIDFREMGERAAAIRMTRCELRQVEVTRLSTRTGQTHSLGGFVGSADYEGSLAEFFPYLETAHWTGVGRQTVWGKGEIRALPLDDLRT